MQKNTITPLILLNKQIVFHCFSLNRSQIYIYTILSNCLASFGVCWQGKERNDRGFWLKKVKKKEEIIYV